MKKHIKGILFLGCCLSFIKIQSSEGNDQLVRRASDDASIYEARDSESVRSRYSLSCCCDCFGREEQPVVQRDTNDHDESLYTSDVEVNRSCGTRCCLTSWCYNSQGTCCWVESWNKQLEQWKHPDPRELCMYRCGYLQGACGTATAYELGKEIAEHCGPTPDCVPLPLEGAIVISLIYWVAAGNCGDTWPTCPYWKNMRQQTASLAHFQEMQRIADQHIPPYPGPPVPQRMDEGPLSNAQVGSAGNDE